MVKVGKICSCPLGWFRESLRKPVLKDGFFYEAKTINKSLSALGNIINALTTPKDKKIICGRSELKKKASP
jgi:hypothetical protein